MNNVKDGSAWDTWRKAGQQWRAETWATNKSALLVASNAFVSGVGGARRDAMKRAFIEGASQ